MTSAYFGYIHLLEDQIPRVDLAYIAAAVLLPLIPAYVLYRTLPGRTSVKGRSKD
jgi:hypothetical protein